MNKKSKITSCSINKIIDFDDLESCRHFLNNMYIDDKRVKFIQLTNGEQVAMEDIPEDQIIQRARELRGYIYGGPK